MHGCARNQKPKMKTIKALSPRAVQVHVASQDITAVYGVPRYVNLSVSNGKPTTTLTLTLENAEQDEAVMATLWYPYAGLKEYEGQEIVFFAAKRRGISIVKSAGGMSWLWITNTAAIFPKDMFVAHMQTKKAKVDFL
jgi:hypothetical protein